MKAALYERHFLQSTANAGCHTPHTRKHTRIRSHHVTLSSIVWATHTHAHIQNPSNKITGHKGFWGVSKSQMNDEFMVFKFIVRLGKITEDQHNTNLRLLRILKFNHVTLGSKYWLLRHLLLLYVFFVAILRKLVPIKSYPMLYVNVISLFPLKNAK